MISMRTLWFGLLVTCSAFIVAACDEPNPDGEVETLPSDGSSESHQVVLSNALVHEYAGVEELARDSDIVVRGTVTEKLDPTLVEPGEAQFENRNPDMYPPTVYTDFVLRVTDTLRGSANETVTVRQVGGTVRDITQEYDATPAYSIGDDLVLFLSDYSDEGYGDVLWVTGVSQGFWRVGPDENIRPPHEAFQSRSFDDLQEELAQDVSGH